MSESRICPVCENEIPEDAGYCPHCDFNLEIINYKESIEGKKQLFNTISNNPYEEDKKRAEEIKNEKKRTYIFGELITLSYIVIGMILFIFVSNYAINHSDWGILYFCGFLIVWFILGLIIGISSLISRLKKK